MIIAFDGHDASGKSTLAKRVAEKLGGTYSRPYDQSLGELFVWLFRQGRAGSVAQIAQAALDRFAAVSESLPGPVVCDRHALSALALAGCDSTEVRLPDHTFLCWTDLPTTLARERARGREFSDEEVAEQVVLLDRYAAVGTRYGVPAVDTTSQSIDDCVEQVVRAVSSTQGQTVPGMRAPATAVTPAATPDGHYRDIDWRVRTGIGDLFDHTDNQRTLLAQVLAKLDGLEDIRILDMGCGDGRRTFELLDALGPRVAKVDWLDPSPLALRVVAERVGSYPAIRHGFFQGRIQEFDASRDDYDCVLSLNSLHVDKKEVGDVLGKLLAITSARGGIFVEMPSTLSTLHRLQLRNWYKLSGQDQLPVGRSADLIERFVALGVIPVEHRGAELVRVEFPEAARYGDLSERQQRLVDWFNGGRGAPPDVSQWLLDELDARAERDERGRRIRSEVSLLVVDPSLKSTR